MNPIKPPKNLPLDEKKTEYVTVKIPEIKIPKNRLKALFKALIIVTILFIASPRIIKNISSTLTIIEKQSQKFPTIFPDLTFTGKSIGFFIYGGVQELYKLTGENLASMGEIFFSRKLSPKEIEIINNGGSLEKNYPVEKTAKPIRIIINKIKVNSLISNPSSTNLGELDKALMKGAVRYPKSGLLGENDNVYIFGHSTSYKVVRNQAYKTFNGIGKLQAGDIIKVHSKNREYIYKVRKVQMEKNSDAVVKFNTGKKTLTLSTCNTLGNKEDRYIVTADFLKSLPLTKTIAKKPQRSLGEQSINLTKIRAKKASEALTAIPINSSNLVPLIIPSNPYGKVDLTAKIIEIGILDKKTNKFMATTTLKSSDRIAFKFVISNLGDKEISDWEFSAVLPTNPLYMYFSKPQKRLGPKEAIEFTLGFDKPKIGKNVIIVNADNTREIFESNEDNNIIKKTIIVTK